MVLLFVYLFLALFVSFICSIMEAVLLSVPISYLKIKSGAGNKNAIAMIGLKEDIDKPLSAILTLNTFAHTIGAAGVGAQAQRLWGDEYLTVVSIVLTIAILIVSEIIPKTLGANYWKQLIPFTVKVIQIMIFLLYPMVLFSQLITKALNRNKETSVLSRADFSAMVEIGGKD